MKYTNTLCGQNVEYHNVTYKESTVQHKIPKCPKLLRNIKSKCYYSKSLWRRFGNYYPHNGCKGHRSGAVG